jgi:hypothetical protein
MAVSLTTASGDLLIFLLLASYFKGSHLSSVLDDFQEHRAYEMFRAGFFLFPGTPRKDEALDAPPAYVVHRHRIEAQCLWLISSVFALPCREQVVGEIARLSEEVYGSILSMDQKRFCRHSKLYECERFELALAFLKPIHQRWPGMCPCSKFDMARLNQHYCMFWFDALATVPLDWEPPSSVYKVNPAGELPATHASELAGLQLQHADCLKVCENASKTLENVCHCESDAFDPCRPVGVCCQQCGKEKGRFPRCFLRCTEKCKSHCGFDNLPTSERYAQKADDIDVRHAELKHPSDKLAEFGISVWLAVSVILNLVFAVAVGFYLLTKS